MNPPKGKYVWTVKIGERGQLVIPKQAREIFGIKPGDTLMLLADEKRGMAIPPKNLIANISDIIFGGEIEPAQEEETEE